MPNTPIFVLSATAQQRALHTLFAQLTDLATAHGLHTASARSPISALARAHVFATLPLLDGEHKGLVLQFLHEALLIGGSPGEDGVALPALIPLRWADLRHLALPFGNLGWSTIAAADLSDADLRGVSFTNANLSGSDLSRANLAGTKFTHCNLMLAHFDGANLDGAYLGDARIAPEQLADAIVTPSTILPWASDPAPTAPALLNHKPLPWSSDPASLPNA